MNGAGWVERTNWLRGDPCANSWLGVTCSRKGQVIGLSFVNNRLEGVFPDSIVDLKYLKFLSIFNDARQYSRMHSDLTSTDFTDN